MMMMISSRRQNSLSRMLLLLLAIMIFAGVTGAQEARTETATLRGVVATAAPIGQSYNIPGASLKLKQGMQFAETSANDAGEYEFARLLPGEYTLEATAEGFKTSSETISIRAGEILIENVRLEVAEVTASVTVSSDAGQAVQTTETMSVNTVKQKTLQTLPLPHEQLLDALPLVPGVVRGPDGQINMSGARASQSSMTVNSANVTDPVTGQFSFNRPVQAVESVQVLTNPYAAEYGKFTGGVTAVATRSGTDKFKIEAQSFFPRFDVAVANGLESRHSLRRLAFSGPLKRNKLWFMQSFEYRFVRTPVESLPSDKRDTDLESFDSVTQMDWDINPRHHLPQYLFIVPPEAQVCWTQHFQSGRSNAELQTARFLLGAERAVDSER